MSASSFLRERQHALSSLARELIEISFEKYDNLSPNLRQLEVNQRVTERNKQKTFVYFMEKITNSRFLDIDPKLVEADMNGIVSLLRYHGQGKKAKILEESYHNFMEYAKLSNRSKDVKHGVLSFLLAMATAPLTVPSAQIRQIIANREDREKFKLAQKHVKLAEERIVWSELEDIIIKQRQEYYELALSSYESDVSDESSTESSHEKSIIDDSIIEPMPLHNLDTPYTHENATTSDEKIVPIEDISSSSVNQLLLKDPSAVYSFHHFLESVEKVFPQSCISHVPNAAVLTPSFPHAIPHGATLFHEPSSEPSVRSFTEITKAFDSSSKYTALVSTAQPSTAVAVRPSYPLIAPDDPPPPYRCVTESYIVQQTLYLLCGFTASPFYVIRASTADSCTASSPSLPCSSPSALPCIFALGECIRVEHLSPSSLMSCLRPFMSAASPIFLLTKLLDCFDRQNEVWHALSPPLWLPFSLLDFIEMDRNKHAMPYVKPAINSAYGGSIIGKKQHIWGSCMQSLHYSLSVCMDQWRHLLQQFLLKLVESVLVELNLPVHEYRNPEDAARQPSQSPIQGPLPLIELDTFAGSYSRELAGLPSVGTSIGTSTSDLPITLLWLQFLLNRHFSIWKGIGFFFERVLSLSKRLYFNNSSLKEDSCVSPKIYCSGCFENAAAFTSSYIFSELHRLTQSTRLTGDIDLFNVWNFFLTNVEHTYETILQNWMFSGTLDDSFGEFAIPLKSVSTVRVSSGTSDELNDPSPSFASPSRSRSYPVGLLGVAPNEFANAMLPILNIGLTLRMVQAIQASLSDSHFFKKDLTSYREVTTVHKVPSTTTLPHTTLSKPFKFLDGPQAKQHHVQNKSLLTIEFQKQLSSVLWDFRIRADILLKEVLFRDCLILEYFVAIRGIAFLEAKDHLNPLVNYLYAQIDNSFAHVSALNINLILRQCLNVDAFGAHENGTPVLPKRSTAAASLFASHVKDEHCQRYANGSYSMATKRLNEALKGFSIRLERNGFLRLGSGENMFHFCNLKVCCSLPWPLDVVFDEDVMNRYSAILAYLLELQRSLHLLLRLTRIIPLLRSPSLFINSILMQIQQTSYSLRWKIQHFVRCLLWYVSWIFSSSWEAFREMLLKCESLWEVMQHQKQYLDDLYSAIFVPVLQKRIFLNFENCVDSLMEETKLLLQHGGDQGALRYYDFKDLVAANISHLLRVPIKLFDLVLESTSLLHPQIQLSESMNTEDMWEDLDYDSMDIENLKSEDEICQIFLEKLEMIQGLQKLHTMLLNNLLSILENLVGAERKFHSNSLSLSLASYPVPCNEGRNFCSSNAFTEKGKGLFLEKVLVLFETLDFNNFYESSKNKN